MYTFNDKRSHYLFHSGIMGMKWGQRNGPPYPLNRSDYSSKEKKLNPAKKNPYKRHNTDNDNVSDKFDRSLDLAQAVISATTLNPFAIAYLAKQGMQSASDIARDRANKKRQATEKTDPKTGFKIKNVSMTASQDMACVNPYFHNLDQNTKNNCMMCTSTFELRRRGYDVTAKKTLQGFCSDDMKVWFPKAQIKDVGPEVTDENMRKYRFKRNAQFERDAINEMVNQGEGARGALNITWRGSIGGHSMAYEVHDGKVTIYDSQANKKYTNPTQILKQTWQGEIVRLDKSPINTKMIREVAE